MFDQIVGNEPIKAYFLKALREKTLPHAILLSGAESGGKILFAKAVASYLLQTKNVENHPDFHALKPEGKSGLHSIDSLRLLIEEVHASAYQGSGKVFVIYDAERMQTASANAILKTLEEPNSDTTLILITEDLSSILPTIRSRCCVLTLQNEHSPSSNETLERSIFELLATKPTYPKLLLELEKIEVSVEDEDPVKKNQNVERLFTAFLLWHRDQNARRLGLDEKALFFPNVRAVDFPLPKMDKIQKAVENARISYQRNIKLTACLEAIFLDLHVQMQKPFCQFLSLKS